MNAKRLRAIRIDAANRILTLFAEGISLSLEPAGIYVTFPYRGGTRKRRWQTGHGQDWYPTWQRQVAQGGTVMIAMAMLVRWVQGRPVYGMHWWRSVCGPQVRIAGDRGDELLAALQAESYQAKSCCVLCGSTDHIADWWSLDGVSGPCCGWSVGCRQKPGGVEVPAATAAVWVSEGLGEVRLV